MSVFFHAVPAWTDDKTPASLLVLYPNEIVFVGAAGSATDSTFGMLGVSALFVAVTVTGTVKFCPVAVLKIPATSVSDVIIFFIELGFNLISYKLYQPSCSINNDLAGSGLTSFIYYS
jgi:hypothetical protein